MHIKELSARVASFKLAAALEKYEMDLRALADPWFDPDVFRRLHEQFGELRLLGASLPRLSVSWVAVLVSRTKLLHALGQRTAAAGTALHEHLAAVDRLHARCLRMMGAQGVRLA
jgi:hypothetical protein